ncbi:MAG TPA: response regulator, partial [Rectinemataceae bacterium]|nr:response regulator [Rectinemataceae bacterium]
DKKRILESYTATDGFTPTNLMAGAVLQTADGLLAFAGVGAVLFNPSLPIKEHPPLKTLLTSFRKQEVDQKLPTDVSTAKRVSVDWSDRLFSFIFAAPAYLDSGNVEYSYRLKGYDKNWIETGTRRYAGYTNLAGGDYTFQVRARLPEDPWPPEEYWSSIAIHVSTHPALRWWAIIGYAVLVTGCAWFFLHRYQRRQRDRLIAQELETKREREARERLERFDKLKDAFLANTSHELRTPLHGIIGIADSLAEGVTGPLLPSTVSNLTLISSSGRRLATLVDDILDFSKLKEGELSLNRRSLPLSRVVELATMLVEPLARSKGLDLKTSIPEDLPRVFGDPDRIQQILMNITGNAIKFTEAGGVYVTAEPIDGGSFIRVSVRDTGIGIPADRQEDIFKPFERIEVTDRAMTRGTGLGLSVTRSLVLLHGGEITVASKPAEGSTFSFTLPVADDQSEGPGDPSDPESAPHVQRVGKLAAEETEEAAPAPVEASMKDIKILIVDDEPVNLQLLANQLSLERYQVSQASNGPDAIDLCRRAKPDLILLDVMMPRMDGYEVCQKIRELYPPAELPVIMVTAKNRVSDLVEGLGVGANDYIPKPFSRRELAARIKTHLQLSQINKAYGRFVPHEFLSILGKESIIDVSLGDQVLREMTVMFADIRAFTRLSENMSPADNFRFINEYFGQIVPAIRERGGIVDKYLGDGILALFPAQVDDALSAAIGAHGAVDSFNQQRSRTGG